MGETKNDYKEIKKVTKGYIPGTLYVSLDGTSKNIEKIPSYCEDEKTIFDFNTFNFHLFPEDAECMRSISQEVGKKREAIIEAFGNKELVIKQNIKDDTLDDRNKIHIYTGNGSNGNIVRLKERKYIKANGLYKYIFARKGDINTIYAMNFMRFFVNQGSMEINCILRCLQFERISHPKGLINVGNNGEFNISHLLGEKATKNNSGNIAYNPDVSFEDSPEEIACAFLEFIDNPCQTEQ